MKVTFKKSALLSACQSVASVVPTRTPKPILRNIKVVAIDGAATLLGTDMEVGIRHKVAVVAIDQSGEVLLPKDRLLSILSEMTGENVTIESRDSQTVVKGDRASFKLGSENPAEFPDVAEFSEADSVRIKSELFRQMIRRTAIAADVTSTRYALGGVLFEVKPHGKGHKLTLVATDTKRLSTMSGDCEVTGDTTGGDLVVPVKAIQVLDRSVCDEEPDIRVSLKPNSATFQSGDVTVYSRLVEGRFPRWRDVIPTKKNHVVTMTSKSALSAVRQAMILTAEESRGVTFKFTPNLLTLSSRTADVGESVIEHPVGYDGAELSITFDPRYVQDCLKVLSDEMPVTCELINDDSPAVWKTEDGFTYLTMPMSNQ